MKGQNFASQVLSRHTFRISRKKESGFFYHSGTLKTFAFSIQSCEKYRPYAKMAALNYSFGRIENSLTNFVFELKNLNNLLS